MLKGDYLYNQVLGLIDYCGDVRKGRTTYSQRYSPNNIRRLYISPDGACVMYHINTGNGIRKAVSFNSDIVAQCTSCPDYVPMLYVLSADRVCASVEEVVLCQSGKNGGILDSREFDFSNLIKSYKSSGSDLKATIMQRYRRLHAFIVYQGGIEEFLSLTSDCNSPLSLLTSSDKVKSSCKIELFNTDDWYKQYGYSAKYYMLDRQGSPLNNHFNKVIDKIESSKKEDGYKEYKRNKLSGKYTELSKEYEKLLGILSCYMRLLRQYNKCGASSYGIELPKVQLVHLYEFQDFKVDKNPFISIVGGSDKDIEALLEENISTCKSASQSIYLRLVDTLVKGLDMLGNEYPVTVETLLTVYDRAIFVPPNVQGAYASRFNGKRWSDSVANTCVLLGVLAISTFKDTDKEVWLSCMS